jgi:hypothetical protein
MSRKTHNKESIKSGKAKQNPVLWVIATLAVIAVALVLSGKFQFISTEEKGKSFHLAGRETRPVLDPGMFTGKTRAAYEAARKYPEILNEVYCYCYCDEPPSNHSTLLSCFTERHGAG